MGIDHETWVIIIRLMIAGGLSGLIGLEREVKRHPAGFRTHLLVGVGSSLMMVLSVFGFESYLSTHPNLTGFDPSRLPSYVVSGIGFLGAGTILVHGVTVRGLTTAASIWVVAGIGLVVGIGMYYVAIFATILVILSLIFLNKWENLFMKVTKTQSLFILAEYRKITLSSIIAVMEDEGISVEKITVEDPPDNEDTLIKYHFFVVMPSSRSLIPIYDRLAETEYVEKVYTVD